MLRPHGRRQAVPGAYVLCEANPIGLVCRCKGGRTKIGLCYHILLEQLHTGRFEVVDLTLDVGLSQLRLHPFPMFLNTIPRGPCLIFPQIGLFEHHPAACSHHPKLLNEHERTVREQTVFVNTCIFAGSKVNEHERI